MTQEKGGRYLSGSTKKIQEELEQQQNRNRNSEEGLQGDEEENRGLGVSSRSSVLSRAHMAQTDGELTEQPQAVSICSMHNTHCAAGSTKTCSRGETKAKTRGDARV